MRNLLTFHVVQAMGAGQLFDPDDDFGSFSKDVNSRDRDLVRAIAMALKKSQITHPEGTRALTHYVNGSGTELSFNGYRMLKDDKVAFDKVVDSILTLINSDAIPNYHRLGKPCELKFVGHNGSWDDKKDGPLMTTPGTDWNVAVGGFFIRGK
jgi:hypothetical protein